MDSDTSSTPIESGRIWYFNKERGYGFITLDSGEGNLFFYVIELMKANMDTIDSGVHVMFNRGLAKDGRPKVSKFIEIGGHKVTEGSYSIVDGRFVFRRNESPTAEGAQSSTLSQKVEALERALTTSSVAFPNKPVAPRINKDEWITVTVKKVRPEHTTYAVSESLGQIKVPWNVMQRAKINGARNTEKFEVRCDEGDDLPVAHEIRRY